MTPDRQLVVNLDLWKALLGIFLILLPFYFYRRSFPPIGAAKRLALALARALAFLLLALFLLDPAIVMTAPEMIEPRLLALVDVSRSMSLSGRAEESRLEEARRGVEVLERALDRKGGVELDVMAFSSGIDDELSGAGDISEAVGEGTDIAGAIIEGERRSQGKNLRAILLFSDGRVTRGMAWPSSPPSVPVFCVGIGDTIEPPDISIEDLVYDRTVYTGSRASVTVRLRAPGYAGRTVALHLSEGGAELDRTEVTIGQHTLAAEATLRYLPAREGDHELVVEARAAAGETVLDNNSEPFRVRVLRDKLRILYLDRYADWNLTFLKDVAARSKRLELDAVTGLPGRGLVLESGGRPFDSPANRDQLEEYDLVIISDDEEFVASERGGRAVFDYVKGGGSLLLMADERSPLLDAELPLGLLPVVSMGGRRIVAGELEVSASPRLGGHPLASLFVSGSKPPPLPARIWGLELTGAAIVPLIMHDRQGEHPFLVMQRVGEGLSAALLGFPVWRWKLAVRDERTSPYDAFFGALIPYLAEGGRWPALSVETSRTVYRTGESIALSVYALDQRPVVGLRGELMRSIDGESRFVESFRFEPDRARMGLTRAAIGPLGPGEYSVRVTEGSAEGSTAGASAEFSVRPVSAEFLRTARDAELLRHLADISGGMTVELESVPALLEQIDLAQIVRERKKAVEFRSMPLLLVSTLVLLSIEWLLRKLWGLV